MSSIICIPSANIKEFDTFIVYIYSCIVISMTKEGNSHISRTYCPLKFTKVVSTIINVGNSSFYRLYRRS